ncbi:MAG: amidohydrolase, partial [Pirellulales bacterium]|nr:amidohydrolase [Pirellulales bacterium]
AAGKLENADVLIRDGLIAAVGVDLEIPPDCQVIDLTGKHLTPGLIDCHSHMGTDGGVNESGQSVTAEVRIGDFIDNSDITIYRQLAGGLTTANILHGSANPIGGQNQVIKLRWGQSMDGLRMTEAPAGIKFALGENVKRNTSRYPNTRMGVEQIIRDQLLAARQYEADWRRWRQGKHSSLPPRKDLQLEAIAEVQRGQRWIHCHSYRQDEIVATLDVLEEFGVQIGTLQHILEGYKVADRMVQHGAMGSSFSDWWAYKFEVFDAIPYNGALMHDRGVVVSFNSDDRELGRHLNTEAAKATKYGGVPEEDALKFVTLNPAKQLRIDPYVGSLVPGKHADVVIWSGRP